MLIAVDIDGTLCHPIWPGDYAEAIPHPYTIENINQLYDAGHEILIYTARMLADRDVTIKWLHKYGVKYHHIQFCKCRADLYIDSDSVTPDRLKEVMDGIQSDTTIIRA
jgi:uncharacterized HAD superfamily protein